MFIDHLANVYSFRVHFKTGAATRSSDVVQLEKLAVLSRGLDVENLSAQYASMVRKPHVLADSSMIQTPCG